MANKATALETYEELGTGSIAAVVCVDMLVEGPREGGRPAVADEATAPETYEVPGTRRSIVNFCVDRLIEGHREGGWLAVADNATASESYEIRLSNANFCLGRPINIDKLKDNICCSANLFSKTSPDNEHYVQGICLPPKGADYVLPPKGAGIGLEVGAHVNGLEVCVCVGVAHFGDGLPPKEAENSQPPKFVNNNLPHECPNDSRPHECADNILLPNATNDALPPDGADDAPAVKSGFKGKQATHKNGHYRKRGGKQNHNRDAWRIPPQISQRHSSVTKITKSQVIQKLGNCTRQLRQVQMGKDVAISKVVCLVKKVKQSKDVVTELCVCLQDARGELRSNRSSD